MAILFSTFYGISKLICVLKKIFILIKCIKTNFIFNDKLFDTLTDLSWLIIISRLLVSCNVCVCICETRATLFYWPTMNECERNWSLNRTVSVIAAIIQSHRRHPLCEISWFMNQPLTRRIRQKLGVCRLYDRFALPGILMWPFAETLAILCGVTLN